MKYEDYLRELQQNEAFRAAEQELRPVLDLADDVLHLRMARNWSQGDLADAAGTKQANISRLESGLGNPTLRFLQKVAAALDSELVVRFRPRIMAADRASKVSALLDQAGVSIEEMLQALAERRQRYNASPQADNDE